MLLKEIMTTKVEALPPDASLFEVAKKMKDADIGTVPIEEKGKIIGMITDRDLVVRAFAEGWDFKKKIARDVMSKDVVYCYDDQTLDDAAHVFEEKKLYRMPVLNHDGKTVGMFSITDLAQHAPFDLTGAVIKAVSQHIH